MRAAQDEVFVVQMFQRVQRAGIHADDLVYLEYQHIRFGAGLGKDGFELVRRAEEQRAEHAVDHHAFRHGFAYQGVLAIVGQRRLVRQADVGEVGDAPDKEENGDEHADFHGGREAEKYREHDGADEQVGVAVLRDDAVHDDDECPGGAADLHTRAAQARDDGGEVPASGFAPDAMAMASGSAITPTVMPAVRSVVKRARS